MRTEIFSNFVNELGGNLDRLDSLIVGREFELGRDQLVLEKRPRLRRNPIFDLGGCIPQLPWRLYGPVLHEALIRLQLQMAVIDVETKSILDFVACEDFASN